MRGILCFPALHAMFFLCFAAASAFEDSTVLTWASIKDTSIGSSFSASRCMASTGSQNLVVKVLTFPSGRPDIDSVVTATVNEADGDTNSISFLSLGDGNYTTPYTFDSNGTYKFMVNVQDANISASQDLNEYIYVNDFSMQISFVNNNASYSKGDTVSLRNLVLNSDGNAFNDLNASTSIYYPDSSTLYSNQQMRGLGNGEYIYSFIAPSTAGTYSATSAFSCNATSDSNGLGRFSVSASEIPAPPAIITVTTTVLGNGGGGGGGGSSRQKIPPLNIADVENPAKIINKIDYEPVRTVTSDGIEIIKNTSYEEIRTSSGTNASVHVFSSRVKNTSEAIVKNVRVRETIPKSIASDISKVTFREAPTTIINPDPEVEWIIPELKQGESKEFFYFVTKSVSLGEALRVSIRDFSLGKLYLGVPSTAKASLSHALAGQQAFLLQLQISNGANVEFYSEQQTPVIPVGKTVEVDFSEQWVPTIAGTYVAMLTLASLDKRTKYDSKVLKIGVLGDLRYDLKVDCLLPKSTSGVPFDFNITATNFGDYYEDVDLIWWVQDWQNQKYGYASMPVAIKPDKSISKDVSVFIPANVRAGIYTARAHLEFQDVKKDATCVFQLDTPEVYYREAIEKLQRQVADLKAMLKEKQKQGNVTDYLGSKIAELEGKIALMKKALEDSDFTGLSTALPQAYSELNDILDLSGRLEKENALDIASIIGLFLAALAVISIIIIFRRLHEDGGKGIGIIKRKFQFIAGKISKALENLLGLGEN
ncbi:Uncharacterised protein [uncultured archaeon]|nr:Uncharacterised protein [uncultured archaeon]